MTAITLTMNFEHRQLRMVQDLDPSRDTAIFSFLDRGLLYEPDVAHVMLRALHDGDVAVDVGANIGFFSVMMAALTGPRGRVVAFEPAADNLERLRCNIATAGAANVTVIDQPVSDTTEQVSFYLNSDSGGGHALWDPGRFPGNTRSQAEQCIVRMTTTTLDAAIAALDLPPPRLIKIDVEGAEHCVLSGAAGLLSNHGVPYIIAELHGFGLKQLGSSQRDLRRFMEGFGYSAFGLYFDGAMPKLIPPGTELRPPHIINLLFSTVEDVGRLWQVERFNPLATPSANLPAAPPA